MESLRKDLVSSPNFSVKSTFRIRGMIHSPRPSRLETLHLQAVIPNITLQMVMIRPVPLLTSSLSTQLLSSSTSVSGVGYLTMNQIRNIIPLIDSDPIVGVCPIIGVWVALASTPCPLEELLAHPSVFGACVKYFASNRLPDKVFISPNTFLLSLFANGSLTCWEVSAIPNNCSLPSSAGIFEFIALDAEASLANNNDVSCDFRLLNTSTMPLPVTGRKTPAVQASEEPSTLSEMQTPEPRATAPVPASVSFPQRGVGIRPGTFAYLAEKSMDDDDRAAMFPASVVLAQQMQIDELRRQVSELRQMVLWLMTDGSQGEKPSQEQVNLVPEIASSSSIQSVIPSVYVDVSETTGEKVDEASAKVISQVRELKARLSLPGKVKSSDSIRHERKQIEQLSLLSGITEPNADSDFFTESEVPHLHS